jgi:predicted AAA+ superfamily ATPase
MDTLIEIQDRLIDQLGTTYTRAIENRIRWTDRMVSIKGARGVGKTTLLLKTLRDNDVPGSQSLYASLDNLYFTKNSLPDLADTFYKKGGRCLVLDEVHKLEGWSRQIKNVYDSYPQLQIVFTGSSVLDLIQGQADLSRRAVSYDLTGLSFREYLQIETNQPFPVCTLEQLLRDHQEIARAVTSKLQPLPFFETYSKTGYYPYYLEGVETYAQRLMSVTNQVLETDLPQCKKIDLRSIPKLKKLLYMIAVSAPMKPNISKLSSAIEVSRQTVNLYLEYLQQACLINLLRTPKRGYGQLTKPEKILLANTNLTHAIAKKNWHIGNNRETFFVNQASVTHEVQAAVQGDFLVDQKWTIEVGGRNKDTSQISGIENAFIAADNIETGHGRKIPLWLFGFLS